MEKINQKNKDFFTDVGDEERLSMVFRALML